ncbi:MAG: HAMP domain-containing protein [Phycisphaerales bacterium]|nr:HAMP domain-containing protein [Phycisphaerales bacterium]
MDYLSKDLHPRWTLRRRLVAMIGAPLLVTFCIVIAVQFSSQREQVIDGLRQATLADAIASSLRIDGEFLCVAQAVESRVAVLGWMSDQLTPIDSQLSRDRIMRLLRADLETNHFIFGAAIAFDPGSPATAPGGYAPYVCRTVAANGQTDQQDFRTLDLALSQKYADEPWFRDAAVHPNGFWTEPYFDKGGGDVLMVTYAQSVKAQTGVPAAVATADVSLRDIRRWMKQVSGGKAAAFAIVSAGNKFISSPKSMALMQGIDDFTAGSLEHSVLKATAAFRRGGAEFVRSGSSSPYSFDGTRMVLVTMPTTNWVFVGFFPEAQVVPVVLRALAFGPGVVLVGVLVALTIVWFGANTVVQPLRGVTAALARLATGDLAARAPMTARRDEIGVLSRAFNRMGDALQSAIAERESATVKRLAVEAQVGAARAIQRLLLPANTGDDEQETMRSTREFAGVVLSGYSEPAGEIAGDFFDWFARSDGTVVVMIADVCGKGMAAAMMMAVSRTLLRTSAMEASDPGEALATINSELIAQAPQSKFMTGILLYIDASTGVIRYSNAGHPMPLLVARDGAVREVMAATGTVLGIQSIELWTTSAITMNHGESLVLFSDGVTEAMVRDDDVENMFGSQRAIAAVSAVPRGGDGNAEQLGRALVAAVEAFSCGNRHDDLTVVTVART